MIEPIERFMAALTTLTAARVLTPLNDNQRKEIALDLDGARIRTREQAGQKLSYVDSVYVIEQLNEVFGYDGWSFTHGAPVIREGARPTVMVSGVLRAVGVERGDTGFAVAASDKPDALETAVKAAVTDCLKRAARTFGNRMGLALYDKAQEGVGWSLEAQRLISAYDEATTAEAAAKVKAQVAAKWDAFEGDERAAINTAARRAATRVGAGAPDPAPHGAPANGTGAAAPPATAPPAAPKPSPSVQLACARVAMARNSRTVAATILACDARGTAAAPVDAAVAALRAKGVDLGDLEAKLAQGRGLDLALAVWNTNAEVLAAIDAAADAPALNKVRTLHAVAVKGLPDALRAGVKIAADARAAELGAETVASRLMARAKAATDDAARRAIYNELTEAAKARRVTATDATAITAVLNGEQVAA